LGITIPRVWKDDKVQENYKRLVESALRNACLNIPIGIYYEDEAIQKFVVANPGPKFKTKAICQRFIVSCGGSTTVCSFFYQPGSRLIHVRTLLMYIAPRTRRDKR
jgi:hypothetical protein